MYNIYEGEIKIFIKGKYKNVFGKIKDETLEWDTNIYSSYFKTVAKSQEDFDAQIVEEAEFYVNELKNRLEQGRYKSPSGKKYVFYGGTLNEIDEIFYTITNKHKACGFKDKSLEYCFKHLTYGQFKEEFGMETLNSVVEREDNMISLEQAQQLTLREMETKLAKLDFDWQKSNDIIENLIIEKAKQGEYELELSDSCISEQSEICVFLGVKSIPMLYFKYLELYFTSLDFKIDIKINLNSISSDYISASGYLKISWN